MIKVSIGIPVYNRPIEMTRTIESIISQTYKNLELIISNNCSTNQDVNKISLDYSNKDNRIIYYNHKQPLPVIDHYNFIKSKLTGDFFLILADDDWIDSNYIEECINFLNQNFDYSLACGNCFYHSLDGKVTEKIKIISIENANPFIRVFDYYKNVNLNGYYYCLKRSIPEKDFYFTNKLGFDWHYIAKFAFRGKVKVIENTAMHISMGGMSTDTIEMNRNIGKNNFFTRNFVGLTVSANAFIDILNRNNYRNIYNFKRLCFALRVLGIVLNKTIKWDILKIKRSLIQPFKK
jgi:glycosyltransferase involved in cell wall biosynthesis